MLKEQQSNLGVKLRALLSLERSRDFACGLGKENNTLRAASIARISQKIEEFSAFAAQRFRCFAQAKLLGGGVWRVLHPPPPPSIFRKADFVGQINGCQYIDL